MLPRHLAWHLATLMAVAGWGQGAAKAADPDRPKTLMLGLGNGVSMRLVLIPAGEFTMGSPKTEAGRQPNEGPQHKVTIARPFYMGITEVTQAQWRAVMNTQPWKHMGYGKAGDDHPASYVNWHEATAFCVTLSKKTGKTVRLPTEAEWEYACRARTTTAYSFGDDAAELGEFGWYRRNAYLKEEKFPHPVGGKKPNAWGLHDMHGNVYEWCSDPYTDSYREPGADAPKEEEARKLRVIRSGSWVVVPQECRSASRVGIDPTGSASDAGFRVVVSLPNVD
jgi:formylglycine-generating enzyme required for sulfatase activity